LFSTSRSLVEPVDGAGGGTHHEPTSDQRRD